LTQEIGKVSADVSIRQAPESLRIHGRSTYLRASPAVFLSLFASDTTHFRTSRCRGHRRRNGDESRAESIRRIVRLEKNPPRFVGSEAGPAAASVSGPRDKELNFPLALYPRGRGDELAGTSS